MTARLYNYPISIDPASPSVDACLEENGRRSSRQFHRVVAVAADLPFTQTVDEAHLFGDRTELTACAYVLVYGHTGRLTKILNRTAAGLDLVDIPPEYVGTPDLFPSVRHTFLDEAARRRYLHLLGKMQAAVCEGTNPSPRDAAEVTMILAQSPTPARSVLVVIPDADSA